MKISPFPYANKKGLICKFIHQRLFSFRMHDINLFVETTSREDEGCMNMVTSFAEKRREKQLIYERKLLRDLSIDELRKSVLTHFNQMRIGIGNFDEGIEEACFDVAIEAYLTGGEYSKFTTNGETMEMARKRCQQDLKHFIDTLYNFWLYFDFERKTISEEDTFLTCEYFIDYWWKKGYLKGERRYKLRLH